MTTLTSKPIVTASDRLGMTLFLAISLHALILLGISFSSPDKPKNQELINTLDITLVQSRSKKTPDDPDYLAQADQIGGGNTQKKVRVKAPDSKSSMLQSPGLSEKTKSASVTRVTKTDQKRVLTTSKSDLKVSTRVKTPKKPKQKKVSARELIQRSQEIARLSAQNEKFWQAYGERPDPKYLHANTKKHQDAAYLLAWTRKVERIGNLNYPDDARRKGLSGGLILEVRLKPNGALNEVRLLQSSGHKTLDDAAIRIVNLA
ncbi:MAG: energy transducer TonB, partial [Gammaproteobacteria bacterium]|nr:energy transducer TonB [Gammaproteobacteria bacterium]